MEDMQVSIMELIVNSGDARSEAMEAIEQAREGRFDEAEKSLRAADNALTKAHEQQADFIQEEADGRGQGVSILMAHAQDHLMNAITVIDMAREFVSLYMLLFQKKENETFASAEKVRDA